MQTQCTCWEHCKHAGGLYITLADVFVAIYYCLMWFYYSIFCFPLEIFPLTDFISRICWFYYQIQEWYPCYLLEDFWFFFFFFHFILTWSNNWSGRGHISGNPSYRSASGTFPSLLPCLARPLWIYILIFIKLHYDRNKMIRSFNEEVKYWLQLTR